MEQFGKSDWIDFEMVESHRREIQQLIENEKLARQVPHASLIEHVIAWLRRREPEETAIPIQKPFLPTAKQIQAHIHRPGASSGADLFIFRHLRRFLHVYSINPSGSGTEADWMEAGQQPAGRFVRLPRRRAGSMNSGNLLIRPNKHR